MKAYLYIVKKLNSWQAYATIAPLVDWHYWNLDKWITDDAGVKDKRDADLIDKKRHSEEGLVMGQPLPLGQAFRAARLFNMDEKRRGSNDAGQVFSELDAGGRLLQIAAQVQQESSEGSRHPKEPAAVPSGNMGFEEWKQRRQIMSEGADGRKKVSLLPLVALKGDERAWYDSELAHIAKLAQQASQLLEGRALLSAEAHALLGGLPGAAGWIAEAIQLAALRGQLRLGGSVAASDRRAGTELRCQRCGSGEALRRTACAACGESDCAYCGHCLTMGRSRECALLIRGAAQAEDRALSPRSVEFLARSEQQRLERWGLSAAQTAAARKALRFIEGRDDGKGGLPQKNAAKQTLKHMRSRTVIPRGTSDSHKTDSSKANVYMKELTDYQIEGAKSGGTLFHRLFHLSSKLKQLLNPFAYFRNKEVAEGKSYPRFLLWAVTGAGKTEMVFPLVESMLLQGGRVLIATPRRDVVIELDPRIRRAFPEQSVVTLYGGSKQRWERGDITLATTHQLMRFENSFDLVIIDELDAFPYVNDATLHYAAGKSGKHTSVRIFLSATPPYLLQREARKGLLPHAKVPVRFHQHPLPVPRLIPTQKAAVLLAAGKLPAKLMNALQQSWSRGAQIFLFVQRIEQTEPFALLLRQKLRSAAIAATSSQDEHRAAKVEQFRNRDIRLLVTTTILERGVTIPRSDVYIMDADGALFDEASLVQMAGRAGRSADDPAGKVYFCANSYNQPQQRAVRHIRSMNRIARKQGYLKASN